MIYGHPDPSVTLHPSPADLEVTCIWGRPFPDSIKKAERNCGRQKVKMEGRIINCPHNVSNCVWSRPDLWRGRPLPPTPAGDQSGATAQNKSTYIREQE